MSIDPKKGGKCWSCKHCEDIATQTNNEEGAYYRKCTKSGHEYVDTCVFSCADYVWDGKDPDFAPSNAGSSSSSSSASSSTAPATKGAGKAVGKLIGALITTAIFAFLGYLLLGYSEYLLASAVVENAPLPIVSDPYTLEMIIVLAPFVMTIILSIIRHRKIWIGSLLILIACVMVSEMLGGETTPSHIPLFIASVAIPYILCLVAILKEKSASVSSSSSASSTTPSKSSSGKACAKCGGKLGVLGGYEVSGKTYCWECSKTAPRSHVDYQCYQCSYYKVDADYNGICSRNNSLVDRYKTACSSFRR